jgi:alpha-beta hydrolase superfamily lysophospholipase
VLSSPALAARVHGRARVRLVLGRTLFPGRALPNGLPVGALSRDPETVTAYQTDPLVHGVITPRLASFILRAGAQARRDAGSVRVPTLLLVAGEDRLVDPQGAREFYDALPAGIGTLHWYDGMYHEVFNAPPEERVRVDADLLAWFQAQFE